jgi:hypothetical protein
MGNPGDPSPQEKKAFEQLYTTLKSNKNLHPHSVENIIISLEGAWKKRISCPTGSMFDKVDFNITTRQISWDRNLVIKGKPTGIGPNDIGWYQWTYKSEGIGKVKTVEATNYIMLDPAIILNTSDPSPFKKIGDEALLYHEVLHGQLVIDSILQSINFQKKVCNCNFDLTAGDFEHLFIPDFEIDYIDSLLQATNQPSAYVIRPEIDNTSTNNTFKKVVADASLITEAEKVSINWYLPRGNNILENKVDVLVEDEKIYVTGKLQNPSKKGLLVVIIETK